MDFDTLCILEREYQALLSTLKWGNWDPASDTAQHKKTCLEFFSNPTSTIKPEKLTKETKKMYFDVILHAVRIVVIKISTFYVHFRKL